MKKKLLAVCVLALAVTIIWFQKGKVNVEVSQAAAQIKMTSPKFSEILRQSPELSHEYSIGSDASPRPDCQDFFGSIDRLDFRSLADRIQDGTLKWDSECRRTELGEIPVEMLTALQRDCIKPDNMAKRNACLSAMMIYRSVRIALANRGQDLKRLSDSELVHMFAGRLSMNLAESKENLNELVAIARELWERMPDSPSASKAVAMAELNRATSDEFAPTVEELRTTNATLDRVRELNPKDWDLFEGQAVMNAHRNPKRKNEIYQQIIRNSGNPGLSEYYQSRVAWDQKRRSEALEHLDRAITLDPKNERYKKTRDAVSTFRYEDHPFYSSMAIQFDDL